MEDLSGCPLENFPAYQRATQQQLRTSSSVTALDDRVHHGVSSPQLHPIPFDPTAMHMTLTGQCSQPRTSYDAGAAAAARSASYVNAFQRRSMSADLAQQDRDAGGECVRAGRSKATVALESEGKVHGGASRSMSCKSSTVFEETGTHRSVSHASFGLVSAGPSRNSLDECVTSPNTGQHEGSPHSYLGLASPTHQLHTNVSAFSSLLGGNSGSGRLGSASSELAAAAPDTRQSESAGRRMFGEASKRLKVPGAFAAASGMREQQFSLSPRSGPLPDTALWATGAADEEHGQNNNSGGSSRACSLGGPGSGSPLLAGLAGTCSSMLMAVAEEEAVGNAEEGGMAAQPMHTQDCSSMEGDARGAEGSGSMQHAPDRSSMDLGSDACQSNQSLPSFSPGKAAGVNLSRGASSFSSQQQQQQPYKQQQGVQGMQGLQGMLSGSAGKLNRRSSGLSMHQLNMPDNNYGSCGSGLSLLEFADESSSRSLLSSLTPQSPSSMAINKIKMCGSQDSFQLGEQSSLEGGGGLAHNSGSSSEIPPSHDMGHSFNRSNSSQVVGGNRPVHPQQFLRAASMPHTPQKMGSVRPSAPFAESFSTLSLLDYAEAKTSPQAQGRRLGSTSYLPSRTSVERGSQQVGSTLSGELQRRNRNAPLLNL